MPQRKIVSEEKPLIGGADKVCLAVIGIYQKYLSPLKPRCCRFYPTCSQYWYDAVIKYGAVRGSALGMIRLLKCHPLHPGGYDPVK